MNGLQRGNKRKLILGWLKIIACICPLFFEIKSCYDKGSAQ